MLLEEEVIVFGEMMPTEEKLHNVKLMFHMRQHRKLFEWNVCGRDETGGLPRWETEQTYVFEVI